MNEKLLENILLFQSKEEQLNTILFEQFATDLCHLYSFLAKEKDIFVHKEETIIKLQDYPQHYSTYQNILAMNKLDMTRDTKFTLFEYLVANNKDRQDTAICMFSLYFFWSKGIKLLKNQQKKIIDLFKVNRGRDYLQNGVIAIDFLMSIDIIKEKTYRENMSGFKFEFIHELNQKQHIEFNQLSTNDFIQYIAIQFSTYKLKIPMTLQKNDISLKNAVTPFLENIDQHKQDLLSTFLDMIRNNLELDNENKQFLDNLILNTKLNQKEIINKIKKPKI